MGGAPSPDEHGLLGGWGTLTRLGDEPISRPWRASAARTLGAMVLGVAVFTSGWLARGLWWDVPKTEPVKPGLDQLRAPGFQFVQPLVECDLRRNSAENKALEPFEQQVHQAIEDLVAQGAGAQIALYFRELNDGLWFSSGGSAQFTPASLRKVPLMIALLKQAEQDLGLLERSVEYTGKTHLAAMQNVRPASTLEEGKSYQVVELIRRMIVYSDNDAFALLTKVVDEQVLREVYGALGVGLDDSPRGREMRSVAAYGGFFRVLFNGTYLSWQRSDQALALLAQTEFARGIREGVPKTVPVAHKFAEHADQGVIEFHDCGIVYYPEHPYVLCVMTRGSSFPKLVSSVGALSRLVYESIDRQHVPASSRSAAPEP